MGDSKPRKDRVFISFIMGEHVIWKITKPFAPLLSLSTIRHSHEDLKYIQMASYWSSLD